MLLEKRKEEIELNFQEIMQDFQIEGNEIIKKIGQIEQIEESVALVLKYLYTSMPYSDIANYSIEVFEDYARHGVYLWENGAFTKEISEDIFLQYVLYHRVNTEEIGICRSRFYEKANEEVDVEDMKKSVLNLNYWCASEVTYRTTDERTLSPWALYQKGYGRCGEESVFTVSVLRSVGIPARQVYVPRWSHCDDNHAWVEVWCDGEWYFLGACEPEQVLNKGWFPNAATRAMMVRSKWYGEGVPEKETAENEGMAVSLNQLARYADTKELKVLVVDEEAQPICGVRVDFEVVNYAQLYPVATVLTNKEGKAVIRTGYGVIHIHASKENKYNTLIVSEQETKVKVVLKEKAEIEIETTFDMIAPSDGKLKEVVLTDQQKALGEEKSARAVFQRNQKIEQYIAKREEEQKKDFYWKRIQHVLTEKDNEEYRKEIAEEHIREAFVYERKYAKGVFEKYVLSPRIYLEHLSCYRTFIKAYFSPREKEKFCNNPEKIWEYITYYVKEKKEKEYPYLITQPVACLVSRWGSVLSQKVLFVAICRSMGIAARINREDLSVQYVLEGNFVTLGECKKNAKIGISGKTKDNEWKYGENWTIAKLEDGRFETLKLETYELGEAGMEISVLQGVYRVMTANRLPNGNLYIWQKTIFVGDREVRNIKLVLREAKLQDMLEKIEVPDFPLLDERGNQAMLRNILRKHSTILFFLEVGKEPTEHILNELSAKVKEFAFTSAEMVFVIRGKKDLQDVTLQSTKSILKNIRIYYDDFSETVEKLARRMYVNPEKLPLIVVFEEKEGIYATSGYNVGTGDMLLRIVKSIED